MLSESTSRSSEKFLSSSIDAAGIPATSSTISLRPANTSAASIPLAMDILLSERPELHGKTALIIGYGAGLVYAGQVVELPPKP